MMVDGQVFGQYSDGWFTLCVESFQKHLKDVKNGVAGISDDQLSELGKFYKSASNVL